MQYCRAYLDGADNILHFESQTTPITGGLIEESDSVGASQIASVRMFELDEIELTLTELETKLQDSGVLARDVQAEVDAAKALSLANNGSTVEFRGVSNVRYSYDGVTESVRQLRRARELMEALEAPAGAVQFRTERPTREKTTINNIRSG